MLLPVGFDKLIDGIAAGRRDDDALTGEPSRSLMRMPNMAHRMRLQQSPPSS